MCAPLLGSAWRLERRNETSLSRRGTLTSMPKDTLALGKGHELTRAELRGRGQFSVVQSGPKHYGELLRSAKQVDVLPDEAGIDRWVEPSILGRDVIHSFAVSDIDEVQWSLGDKILRAGLGVNISAQGRQQLVRLRAREARRRRPLPDKCRSPLHAANTGRSDLRSSVD